MNQHSTPQPLSWHHIRGRQPRLHCHDNAQNRHIVAALPQLHAAFRPTPWLFNEHAQLIFHSVRKKGQQSAPVYDQRDLLTMRDGGQTALEWCGYDLPADTPTIVVLHTITGSPQSMSELVQDLHTFTGWRVVLCLRRGHAGLPLRTPRLNILGCTHDLREQLQAIRARFPASPLYAVGSSAGSGVLVRYLGEEGDAAPFRAAFAYCPGYNTDEGFTKVHPFYSRLMAKKLARQLITPHLEKITHLPTTSRLLNADNLADFHRHMYELAGYASYDDYDAGSNPMRVFGGIKTPLMILNAEDDPVCRIGNVLPYLDRMQQMPDIILATTAQGSHCAHYEGWAARSWSARLMGNYFRVMHQLAAASPSPAPIHPVRA